MAKTMRNQIRDLTLAEFLDHEFFLQVLDAKGIDTLSPEAGTIESVFERCKKSIASDWEKRTGKKYGESKVADLLALKPVQLLEFYNFGKKSLKGFNAYLSLFDLNLSGAPVIRGTGLSDRQQKIIDSLKK